ncbi:hypothetical protein OF83DRAFT_1171478 [Amylostereum chailletii]|nr:hypothetical protein OF83DRAFT_1171478 [Amylostereum chailletii]
MGVGVAGSSQNVIPAPLLCTAVAAGSANAVDYLAGPHILVAFQNYVKHGMDAQARALNKVENLQGSLPKWLGWDINELNESPLTAAVMHNQLNVARKMWEYRPELMLDAMDAKTKFTGFNFLLSAAWGLGGPEMIDFLLSKGCSSSERDIRGYMEHLPYSQSAEKAATLKHVLKVLLKELTSELLAQKSKDAYNTPLMKRGDQDNVKALVQFGIDPSVYLMKDSIGSTVLHVAEQNSSVATVPILIK